MSWYALGDAQPGKEDRRLGLCLPAAELGELGLQLGRPDAVGLAEIRLLVERDALGADVVELRPSHDDGVDDPALLEGEMVLGQDGHAPARPMDISPLSGVSSPERRLRKVDLPAPFAPMMP